MNIEPRKCQIIGVPMDLGASRRGVDMGPSALRIAGLGERIRSLDIAVEDLGNLSVAQPETLANAKQIRKCILDTCEKLSKATEKAVSQKVLPISLGGDHSIAMGSVAGVARGINATGQSLGLLWLDTHADCNTPETSITGNWHGMPLAHLLGFGDTGFKEMIGEGQIALDRVVIIGLRDVDKAEAKFLREQRITTYTMRDIDELGLRQVMRQALDKVSLADTEPFHVSLDLDWVDPAEAPGVGTPVQGGAGYREAHLAMEMIADQKGLVGLDVVEVNPLLDRENMTAKLSVELVASILGKKILGE